MGAWESPLVERALAALPARPIVVATHPRSGTHLAIDALRWRAAACRIRKLPMERLDHLYFNVDATMQRRGAMRVGRGIATLLRARRPLIKTHTMAGFQRWYLPARHHEVPPPLAEWLRGNAKVLQVCRDGRASVWSYYLLAQRAGAAREMSFGEFLRRPSDASVGKNAAEGWARHVRSWRDADGVLTVRFEDLVREPEPTLGRIAGHLGLELEPRERSLPRPMPSVNAYRLARLPGGHPESTAILAPDPVEPARKWRDVFSREDGRAFEEETGGLLRELGYVEDGDWWRELPARALRV